MIIDDNATLKNARRAGIAGFIGTTIEWYDFFVFTTASGLIFGKIFFPAVSPGTGVLASFAALWVGYIGRPLGGILFGHVGDRLGRKNALITTLLGMGVCTVAIGLLPTYQQVGIMAPVLLALLRILQGVALGGEWGGAVLIASESAPKDRKISFGNFAQQGTPTGALLSTVVFIPVATLPAASFASWGWRIPFLLSAVLVVVGVFVRMTVTDPPEFEEARRKKQLAKVPVVETFRGSTGLVILGVGACAVGVGMSGMKNPFALSWLTSVKHMHSATVLNILTVAAIVQFVVQPIAAHWARRYGTGKIIVGSLIATVVTLPLVFWLMSTGQALPAAIGMCVFMATQSGYYAILAGFISATGLFPARVRYTGISLSYQVAGSVFGAIPLVAQLLLAKAGGIWAAVAFYGLIILLSIACVLAIMARQRRTTEPAVPVTTANTTEGRLA